MKPYRYDINFGLYGAELIAGSLDPVQVEYWSMQPTQKLLYALFNPESQSNVPLDARIGDYSEMDNIRHLWAHGMKNAQTW